MSQESQNYLKGSIVRTLLTTGLAMIPATLAMSLYNIVDTYFVSRLGLEALAAMGFCFPIVGVVSCIYHSMSTAVMTLLSHALGRQDDKEAARILLHGLIFMFAASLVIGIAGAASCRWLCSFWVETPEVLEYVCQFMTIWLVGNFTISLAMSTHKFVLALGFPKKAATWMLASLGLNVILEPLFIFGPTQTMAWMNNVLTSVTAYLTGDVIPPSFVIDPGIGLGMYGAAIATVIAQALTPVGCLPIIHRRLKIWTREALDMSKWNEDVLRIVKFSIPTILGMIIMPLSGFVATGVAAHFGDKVVAAMACISRLETLAFVVPMSIGMALMPMFAQNYGAGQFERIDKIRRISQGFAACYLFLCAAVFTILSSVMVGFFTDDAEVLAIGSTGLSIICWGFAGQEVHRFGCFCYNGCNRPGMSAIFNIIKIFGMMIPLLLLALVFEDYNWIFWGRLISELAAAVMVLYLSRRLVRRLIRGEIA